MRSSASPSLDVPQHANSTHSPPRSSQSTISIQIQGKKRSNDSSSLLRIIGVAIILVLAFHWYLVLHHVSYHAPGDHVHHAILASSIVDSGKTRRNGAKKNSAEKDPYVSSPVCGGCYRTSKDGTPCFDLIEQYMKQHDGTSLYDASISVGQDVKECSVCNPETCYKQFAKDESLESDQYQTKYWRFDQTAPDFTSPTSLVLSSIPDELRIPPSRYDDIEAYIRTKYANPNPENITNVFLMEYNPGIAKIPEKMRPYLPWNARYLLSLRVTPHNFCFGIWLTEALTEDIKQTMHSLNHLGLALLDDKLQMIPGYDVVIDIDIQLDAKRMSLMGEPAFVDYRIFTLNDELYLHINSDTVILTKLKLRSKDSKEYDKDAAPPKKGEKQYKLKNLYGGDALEVTLLHQFNTVWGEGKHSIFGKNYALFALPNATHPSEPDSIYAEMSVYPEHMVQQILPEEYDKLPKDRRIKWRQRRNFKIDHIIQRRMRTRGNATVSDSTAKSPIPSFFNADEHWFPGGKNPFKEFAHGGACCVSVSLEDISAVGAGDKTLEQWKLDGVDSLLVGVGHTLVKYYTKNKMPEKERVLMPDTNYVSFFYAFDPRPPFELLVRSGYFCLGFADENDRGTANPRSILTHNRPLQQNNETFACPQIHYVETIIEKADDPSSVIIGYGMNDCTARLVQVEKSEIAKLLFPDPWDMVMSKS